MHLFRFFVEKQMTCVYEIDACRLISTSIICHSVAIKDTHVSTVEVAGFDIRKLVNCLAVIEVHTRTYLRGVTTSSVPHIR